MDSSNPSSLVGLLNSQQHPLLSDSYSHNSFPPSVELGSSQVPPCFYESSQEASAIEAIPRRRKERQKWTPSDDVNLISAWLNTSKDSVVGNEQKLGTFWKRIAAYMAPMSREPDHCKQRWQKINELVQKFCGAYDAATRGKASGQNDDDVLKVAYDIFFNDYGKRFNLVHTWRELRYDQKWLSLSRPKTDGTSKRRKCNDGSQVGNSDDFTSVDGQATERPPGVKAAKNRGKKKVEEGKSVLDLEKLESVWSIKKADMALRERVSKMAMLESILAKKEPLSEIDEAIKQKLFSEMFM
uniref:Glutathione S-transferase T3 n=1 Tax=Noccaea caerulescens TaxID=107243 RepID=A0A1J3G2K0_NOCCA